MIALIQISLIFLCLLFFPLTAYGVEFFHKFQQTYSTNSDKLDNRTISVGLKLVNITPHNHTHSKDIYSTIISHSKQKPFGDKYGRSTNAHETVHGINSELRQLYRKNFKHNINALYAGGGCGVIIKNPAIKLRDVVPYIPNILRGYRYNLYFVKQLGDWDEVPTYPMDEWSAYIAGAECAVDDVGRGIAAEKSDCVSGVLEFSIYCTALALSIRNKDTEYWKEHTQFKDTIQYFLIKSEKTFFEGQDIFPFKEQNELLKNLREHPDASDLRNFLLTEFQGVFVD